CKISFRWHRTVSWHIPSPLVLFVVLGGDPFCFCFQEVFFHKYRHLDPRSWQSSAFFFLPKLINRNRIPTSGKTSSQDRIGPWRGFGPHFFCSSPIFLKVCSSPLRKTEHAPPPDFELHCMFFCCSLAAARG
ncbi:unnamed protein product, partial [Discosporangium mesarthrocarpum]